MLSFEFTVTVKDNRDDGLPNFLGPMTQGPATGRFIDIDIGKLAGQPDSCWERRIKVPLSRIIWDMIQQVCADSKLVLEAHLPGTAKDGGPSCATVHPAGAGIVASDQREPTPHQEDERQMLFIASHGFGICSLECVPLLGRI
jgi:hypothetical protein